MPRLLSHVLSDISVVMNFCSELPVPGIHILQPNGIKTGEIKEHTAPATCCCEMSIQYDARTLFEDTAIYTDRQMNQT